MPEDPAFYILKSPHFPPAHLAPLLLGRIVKNYASPFADFTPVDPRTYLDKSVGNIQSHAKNVTAVLSSNTNSEVSVRLQGVAEFSAHANGSTATDFKADSVRSVRVQGVDDLFDRLMKNTAIEKKVRGWLFPGGTKPAYLIVGLCIWENASLSQETTSDRSAGGSLTLAAGEIAAAVASGGAAANWLSGLGDLTTDISVGSDAYSLIEADFKGRHIFAVECRNVYRPLATGFAPAVSDKQPRYPPGRSFAGQSGGPDADSTPAEEPLTLDTTKNALWVDALEEEPNPPTVEEVNSFCFAYDNTESEE